MKTGKKTTTKVAKLSLPAPKLNLDHGLDIAKNSSGIILLIVI